MRKLACKIASRAAQKVHLFSAVVSLAVVFAIPACYTLLKHPTVLEDDYSRAETNNCGSCHSETDLWGYHHPRDAYYPGGGYYDEWLYYYEMPWWFESYWFYDRGNGSESVPLHQRSLRPDGVKGSTTRVRGTPVESTGKGRSGDSSLKMKIKKKDDKKDDSKKEKNSKRSLRKKGKKKKKNN